MEGTKGWSKTNKVTNSFFCRDDSLASSGISMAGLNEFGRNIHRRISIAWSTSTSSTELQTIDENPTKYAISRLFTSNYVHSIKQL